MPPDSDAESKLTKIENLVFEEAVERATEAATQRVAQVHRRRLVVHTAGVVIVVMAAFGFIILMSVNSTNTSNRLTNQRYNCRLLTNISSVMSSFVYSDARLRRQQLLNSRQITSLRPGALKRLFSDPETARLSRQSQQLDQSTTLFWERILVPRLDSLASTNCTAGIH